MNYEIDFLPVGNGEKSGDAICLRYSINNGQTWIVGVIDGGTQESGGSLCEHITKYYKTDIVDFIVSTHPHADHASGLSEVMDNLAVKHLIMHRPWEHVNQISDCVIDGRVTRDSIRKRLIEGCPLAYSLEEKANQLGIPIHEPFSDYPFRIPCMTILGPSSSFYLSQLNDFQSITEATDDSLYRQVVASIKEAITWSIETWNCDKLAEPAHDATSSENNSSAILLFTFGEEKLLFTGDAGTPALYEAVKLSNQLNCPLNNVSFLHVPHHGSKRNIGPNLLNQIIGPILPQDSSPKCTAMISASVDGEPQHPSKKVVNALIRRGAKVITTQGKSICHFNGTLNRNWSAATPLSFYTKVETDED